jgi:alginate O-acetyltransferase complex protein AlgI
MVFSSYVFLYVFLPLFLIAYFLSPRSLKSLVIALSSYLFYGWWRPDFVLLMLFSTVVDFACGKGIERAQARGERGKNWVWLSCVTNLSLLGYFKYANFGIETLNRMIAEWGMEPMSWTAVVLPVGISFYTFQTMSYTIDVYRREAPPVRRFTDFMCFVALFPQLIAGPIVRYRSVAEELRSRTHTLAKVYQGIVLFQIGFAKKILIADNVGHLADQAFSSSGLAMGDAWLGLLGYTFQIYFDFSGYSDMAIGLGLILGFTFPINFNQPYRSVGITDFWRRWHISLSSWLRDYLYIPLGGNKRGPIRTYINLALTMLLGGLWHGANWTFIVWGAYQGFWLIVERLVGKRTPYAWLPRSQQVLVTFLIVMGGWVFFRSDSMGAALDYFQDLVGVHGGRALAALEYTNLHIVALTIGAAIVWMMPTSQSLAERGHPAFALFLQPLFLTALLQLHGQSHQFFIYFQF